MEQVGRKKKKNLRFDSRVKTYFFDSGRDFLGKGGMGTVVRTFRHGNLASKPLALKIIRKDKLVEGIEQDGRFGKWM